jgi:NMD protein affecting ribosome stability and mRNA decay
MNVIYYSNLHNYFYQYIGSWHAVVQVRQRVTHKRTFYYLEQLLLKHNAHSDCLNIVTFRDGMDFYFTGIYTLMCICI